MSILLHLAIGLTCFAQTHFSGIMKDTDGEPLIGVSVTWGEGQEDDPLLFLGWRGQNDDWGQFGCEYTGDTLTNLAIKGLFKPLSDNEISALEAEGYKAQAWGSDIVKYEDEYYTYLFYDYDYTKAPIYLWPFTPQILSVGGFQNGYGFKNE